MYRTPSDSLESHVEVTRCHSLYTTTLFCVSHRAPEPPTVYVTCHQIIASWDASECYVYGPGKASAKTPG